MIRELFYGSLVKFLCHFIIGREVEGKEILPEKGPAILIANHNSHLDALMILSLFPRNQIRNIGCIINGVDEKMILFSQCHFFLQKKLRL
ncbi:lysophospholipid acyltransferase family protein [Fusobacterium necrophorum]|uniref:lysophospholipid acyltransferase family protein n=1 Tax=Fusobacterium necrophorum TaxID=859 RepID=UPI000245E13E|nr:1-acyl-sn-glycerol-3-phosphate acyltransferase [Fusobacterium necrophorum]EHO18936.1 hypothetical protein HMPREF9466_02059 [Fusobacterium necrophorum subsp. funduliforme 1_1_36S]